MQGAVAAAVVVPVEVAHDLVAGVGVSGESVLVEQLGRKATTCIASGRDMKQSNWYIICVFRKYFCKPRVEGRDDVRVDMVDPFTVPLFGNEPSHVCE